jgi:hypothetical protein
MSTLPTPVRADLDRVQRGALIVGVAALLLCVIGAPFSPTQFFRAYTTVYQFFLGLALGNMVILMLYHLTGGAWGFLIRRFLEAGMRTLPLLAVLFTPVACGIWWLFPWAQDDRKGQIALGVRNWYLNPAFFWGRAALYFILWNMIAFFLSRWSREQDATGATVLPRKFRLLSAPSFVIYGATITFASVDWAMSLTPAFHSTMWGPLYAAGQLVSGMALATLVLCLLVAEPPLRRVVSLEALNDVGNLLFSFLIIWAYMAFFQFMLIWMANMRDEVIWYLPRGEGGWRVVIWAVFLLHFAVPFFCLLMRTVKRDPPSLARVAGLLLFMHLVYLYWQIVPSVDPEDDITAHWMDILMPFGIGGIWLAFYVWQLKRFPLLPLHDTSAVSAAELRAEDEEQAAREEAVRHG